MMIRTSKYSKRFSRGGGLDEKVPRRKVISDLQNSLKKRKKKLIGAGELDVSGGKRNKISYSQKDIVLEMLQKGSPISDIVEEANLPIQAVYNLKSKFKKEGKLVS